MREDLPDYTDEQLASAEALLPARFQMNSARADIINALVRSGGKLEDRSGYLRSKVDDVVRLDGAESFSKASQALDKAGVLHRETNQSRTFRMSLSDHGWQVAEALGLDVSDRPDTLPAPVFDEDTLRAGAETVNTTRLSQPRAQFIWVAADAGGELRTTGEMSFNDLVCHLTDTTTPAAAGQMAGACERDGLLTRHFHGNAVHAVSLTDLGRELAAALGHPGATTTTVRRDDADPATTPPAPTASAPPRPPAPAGTATVDPVGRLRAAADEVEALLDAARAAQQDEKRQAVELISDVVDRVNGGDLSPLQALGEIEAVLAMIDEE